MAGWSSRRGGCGWRVGLAWLGVVTLAGAGCGETASGPGPGGSDTAVHLRVLMSDDWADTRPFVDVVRAFEQQHRGVRVQIDKLGAGDVLGSVEATITQGAPPDVVQGHAFAAAARGWAEPLDDLWTAARLTDSEFLPGAVEDVMWGDHHYGLPLDTNAVVLFYDAEQFAAANLPSPDTWRTFADLERAAEALSTPDGSRHALALSDSTWRAYAWMSANGGEVVDVGPDGTPRFDIDAPTNVESLRFLRGLVEKGLAFHPPTGASAAGALSMLRSGATAMFTSGSNDLVTLRRGGGGDRFKIARLPQGMTGTTPGSAMGGSSLFVPRGAANRKLGFEFMRQLISDASALRFATEANRLPVRRRVYDDGFFRGAESQTVLAQLESAHVYKLEAFAVARQAFGDAIRDALGGAKEPGAALHDAQAVALASAPS